MSIVTYILTSWILGFILGIQDVAALIIIAVGSMIPSLIDSRMDRASKHGFSHSILIILLMLVLAKWVPFMRFVAIGSAATIFIDCLGRKPVQVLWPIKQRFSIPLIEKGKPVEFVYVAILLIILFGRFMTIDTLLEMMKTIIDFFGFFLHQIVYAISSLIDWIVVAVFPQY